MSKIFYTVIITIIVSYINFGQTKPTTFYPSFNEGLNEQAHTNSTYSPESVTITGNVYQDGADRLATLQNNDGGWDWPLDDGDPNNVSPKNTVGPIAMGLAKAYHFTGDATHSSALINAGVLLLSKTNNFSPSDGYLAATLDQIFGGNTYTTHVINNFYNPLASGTYDRNGAGTLYSTATYVDLIRTSRAGGGIGNLAAWDLGMGLVGAAMCGAATTDWIAGVKAEIDELDGTGWYDVIGLAGAIYGLAFVGEDYDPIAGEHVAASNINDLANILASYQINFGGFAWNKDYVIANDANEATQETAYSILALNETNRELFITNIEGAGNFLINEQLATGGWDSYPGGADENNEITGEALWGIHTSFPELWVSTTGNDANSGSIYNPLATIQQAILNIPYVGKINLNAETYTEGQIVINKSLTIQGQGKDVTVLNSNYNTANSNHGDDASAWIRTDPNTMVYISDMTLDATGFDTYAALRFKSSGEVSNVHINEIKHSASQYRGIGIQVLDGNVDVTNCVFTEIGRIGVHYRMGVIAGASVTGTYDGNTYTGKGDGDWLDYALDISGATTVTVKNSTVTGNTGVALSDGSTSGGFMATTYFPFGLNLPNDVTILNNELTGNTDGISVGYDALDVSVVEAHNNNIAGNFTYGINSTAPIVNATNNWWGDASGPFHATSNPSGTGDTVTNFVVFDPWTAQLTVTQINTTYSFPSSGVDIEFSTLPQGGGTVTVQRYEEIPQGYPAPPAGATHAGLWLDFSSSMPNFSFNATITVDVTGLGFDASTSVMYFNSSTDSWVAVSGGTYAVGPPETFTFNTNHFTPFSFINTPATAYDVFVSSSTSAAAGAIYPNTDWGFTSYDPNDWDFTTPITLYIVPEVGSVFGASDFTIQWDNTLFSYVNVVKTGGIYDGANFLFYHSQLGNTDQVTINASALTNSNITVTNDDYIAKLELNLIMPGYGPINFTAMDFRAFNGSGGFDGVYVIGNGAQVKSYLGDVGKAADPSTGDGLVDFEDLNLWAPSYWSGVGPTGMANYKVKYDVGPTSTNTVYGLPSVDSKIQFEDLVIFSMSYGLSGDHVYPKIKADPKIPVKLELGPSQFAGNETFIPLYLKGGIQNIRAFQLKFSGNFGKFKRVERGSLLNDLQNPAILMDRSENGNVFVDIAIFGADDLGINDEGELVVLVFEGRTDIEISTADVRNILNKPMAVEFSGDSNVPDEFALSQNYPNPFNPSTTINYQIATKSNVKLVVYNMLGEQVATLVNELQQPGSYQIEWNASYLSSGIYFYQIKANDFVSVKKMILMK